MGMDGDGWWMDGDAWVSLFEMMVVTTSPFRLEAWEDDGSP